VLRFPAGSSPRSVHSIVHKRIAGAVSCHSPKRTSYAASHGESRSSNIDGMPALVSRPLPINCLMMPTSLGSVGQNCQSPCKRTCLVRPLVSLLRSLVWSFLMRRWDRYWPHEQSDGKFAVSKTALTPPRSADLSVLDSIDAHERSARAWPDKVARLQMRDIACLFCSARMRGIGGCRTHPCRAWRDPNCPCDHDREPFRQHQHVHILRGQVL
jgi:hypothetical protein